MTTPPTGPLPPPNAAPPAAAGGLWQRFARRHLHDYNPAATRLWLALAAAGACSLALALFSLAQGVQQRAASPLTLLLALGFVALVASFPIHIPRTRYSFSVSDVFVFTLLATYGAPVAVAAAAIEGLAGVLRASKRLSSHISTPSAASLAMTLCALGFETLQPALHQAGLDTSLSMLVALCVMALPYFAGVTLPLIAIVAAKNGQRLSLRDWARGYSWMGAIYLLSAAVAGVVAINVRQFGPALALTAALLAVTLLGLVNLSLRHHEQQLKKQDAKLDDAQREADLNQRRFTAAFEHAAIGMAIVRPDGHIHQVNAALCSLLGHSAGALQGRTFEALLHPVDAERLARQAPAVSGPVGAQALELRCRHADGHDIWVSLHCSRFADPGHEQDSTIYQLHDISSRRDAERQLQHIAYHDGLTELANRNSFNARLEQVIERSRVDATQRFAVCFLDLDRFKVVNDSLGHAAGNHLLREVAQRLVGSVRPTDLVARLGGDEFAVLLEQVTERGPAMALAERLLQVLSAPMRIASTEVAPGASIGITFSDMGYRSADEVLRDADLAMYAAKAGGRNRVALFDSSLHEQIAERMALESDLRQALADDGLTVEFQPLWDLERHTVWGFEALARWHHPTRGTVSPAVFIALAEESGHISALTRWVIDRAAGQLARWRAAHPAHGNLDLHVNISGRDLADPGLVTHVRGVLLRHALPARCLTLEITETTLMGSLNVALGLLGELRELGVRLSIDDFGTGYSSLAYLSTLPIDSLKIDRSFVVGLGLQPQAIEIVRAVLNLGRSLGKTVIAEGIETAAQLAALTALGVPVGQGYLLARPMRPEAVDALLAGDAPGAASTPASASI